MSLFSIPENKKEEVKNDKTLNIKLRKGDSIDTLINQARSLVLEKLSNYKDLSTNIFNKEELENFFNETEENCEVAIDTETTGLNWMRDKIVGISLCNGKHAVYIPINHKSATLNERLNIQIDPEILRQYFIELKDKRKDIKWIYHNAKFDLGVLRTFLGVPMPDPYWDTLIGRTFIRARWRAFIKIFI